MEGVVDDSASTPDPEITPENTIKILIATDNHLGFAERDRVRRDDSFIVFEEILQTALKNEVDMVLLGGDLFDENKPSRYTTHRTMELFRKYIFGDRPIQLRIHSDQADNFRTSPFGRVNYEDPNLNIALPVFSIHGNHDDPTGETGLSAMDLLSMTSMVNYFGKSDNIDEIHVKPVLLSKGKTKLALYGLGWIRDERLYRSFQQKKVKFYRPKEAKTEWFNLFMVHQNRNQHHARKGNIRESMLRGFFDLVVWGHEHECRIEPQMSAEGNFDVMQPGSSVITSLIREESVPKQIALVQICKQKYSVTPIQLQCQRTFVYDEVILENEAENSGLDKNNIGEVTDFLAQKVEELVANAKERLPSASVLKKYPGLAQPLIRLRVDRRGGWPNLSTQRFGQKFVDRVANPGEILLLTKPRTSSTPSEASTSRIRDGDDEENNDEMEDVDNKDNILEEMRKNLDNPTRIEDLIAEFLRTQNKRLELLDERNLAEAVSVFVQKEEAQAIAEFVEKELRSAQKHIWKSSKDVGDKITQEDIIQFLVEYAEEHHATQEVRKGMAQLGAPDEEAANSSGRSSKVKQEAREHSEEEDDDMPQINVKREEHNSDDDDAFAPPKQSDGDDDDDNNNNNNNEPPRGSKGKRGGRGRGGRGPRGGRGASRGSKKASTSTASTSRAASKRTRSSNIAEEPELISSEDEYKPPSKRGKSSR